MTMSLNENSCNVVLYHADNRIYSAGKLEKTELVFSPQSMQKANRVICAHFGVVHEWDQKLFNCALLNGDYEWFGFKRESEPHITMVVEIHGDRNVFFNEMPELYLPMDRKVKINVVFKHSIFRVEKENKYALDFDDINFRMTSVLNFDYSASALFNAETINKVGEVNNKVPMIRMMERIYTE